MRLLASGCSATDYSWSTWADILGAEFPEYLQVGMGGADNAFIARSIINHVRPNDTVIIMWTSYDRWSFYSDTIKPLPKDANNHWQHTGSLALWDKRFYVNYYHRVERFQTTMDYIQLIDLHSKVNGYKVYHFSVFPFFLAETEKDIDPRLVEIYNKYNIDNNYLTTVPAITEFRKKNYNILVDGNNPHPTPMCQWDYAEQIMAPRLNIQLTQSRKSIILKEHQDLL